MSSARFLMSLLLGTAAAAPFIRSEERREKAAVLNQDHTVASPGDASCTHDNPCQRADGVLSADMAATTSTLTHATLDQDVTPNGRWCGVLQTQDACEQEFTFKKCSLSDGEHTVYYPCQWNAQANKKCYAGIAFTAPGGVLLADGTRHAETCNCASGCAHHTLQGVAADDLFGGEHCLGGETMDVATKRCIAAATTGSEEVGGEEGEDLLALGAVTAKTQVLRMVINADGDAVEVNTPKTSQNFATWTAARIAKRALSSGAPRWMLNAALDQINPHEALVEVLSAFHDGKVADATCTHDSPCQRADGVLSDDESATTSTLTHATLDQDVTPNGRWCGVLQTQDECEQEFTFKNCALTDSEHTVYYPCLWNAQANKKCYAGIAFTAPGGVLLADGTRHAETCDCASGCAHHTLQGVAADDLFGGEHCLGSQTMDAGTKRCIEATEEDGE